MRYFSDEGSFVGTAGYGPEGTLTIGQGERVVQVDMDPARFAVPGTTRSTGIGVYRRGALFTTAEVVISPVAQPSALELQDRRANEPRRKRLFPSDPPPSPGEFLGIADFSDGWKLRIGAGQDVVEMDMEEPHWFEDAAPAGICVYIRRGGVLGFDEIVLTYQAPIGTSEWREFQERMRRLREWGRS